MSQQMKYHRIVFRWAEKTPMGTWRDIVDWSVPVDFGWFTDLNASLKNLQETFKGNRMVRHFAITEGEMYNGLCHKLHKPAESVD